MSTPSPTLHINPAWNRLTACRSVLLLQGPVGPFFDRVASHLLSMGKSVHRIAFQGGDLNDSRVMIPDCYRGTLEDWPAFLDRYARARRVDGILFFGQHRAYHTAALDLCAQGSPAAFVLEEGYFRPGFATLEIGGVNGLSQTLVQHAWHATQPPTAAKSKGSFRRSALFAATHYIAMQRHQRSFPHYQHHRHTQLTYYARHWLRTLGKKWVLGPRNNRLMSGLQKIGASYYLLPLQHSHDTQLAFFSRFRETREILEHVLASFRDFAPQNTALVIKQHPMARGSNDPDDYVSDLAERFGLSGRVHFILEGNIHEMVLQSKGVITVNSSTAVLALEGGVPVVCMGRSVFDPCAQLFRGELSAFWAWALQERMVGDAKTAAPFIRALKALTQIPTDLYGSASLSPIPERSELEEGGPNRRFQVQLSDRLSEEIWPNLRRRALAHWLFLASVALPTLLSAVYFGFVASDVFISESRFLVRSPSKDSISTIGGSFGSFIGKMGLDNSENDSHTAENFILSRDALIVLNDKLGIKAAYSSERVDIFRRFAGLKFWDKSFESFYDYYASQVVSISYDRDSGITALSVRAFDPSLARRINQELNLLSEALINRLNTRARQDMLNFARSEVLLAKTKVEETNRKLHLFRTEKQNGSPSQNVALYQQLVNEKDFADRNLAAALASLEQARVEALKKQLYLERVAEPSEPDWPAEPKRIRGVATTFAMGLLVWGLASMIIAGVREHQEHA